MKTILAALLLVTSSVFAAEDPIARLSEELSKNPLWINGEFPSIMLPATAKPEEVIKECFKMTGFARGHVTDFEIKEQKKIKIKGGHPEGYSVARCESDLGGKIVLFRYESPKVGWWTRVYDARYYYKNGNAEPGAAANSHPR